MFRAVGHLTNENRAGVETKLVGDQLLCIRLVQNWVEIYRRLVFLDLHATARIVVVWMTARNLPWQLCPLYLVVEIVARL